MFSGGPRACVCVNILRKSDSNKCNVYCFVKVKLALEKNLNKHASVTVPAAPVLLLRQLPPRVLLMLSPAPTEVSLQSTIQLTSQPASQPAAQMAGSQRTNQHPASQPGGQPTSRASSRLRAPAAGPAPKPDRLREKNSRLNQQSAHKTKFSKILDQDFGAPQNKEQKLWQAWFSQKYAHICLREGQGAI